ncbi:hypothetical protein GGS20DRAFT_441550 [Poronia punctata]|nr:hypothetical protein GGS20DRAFT_441550 [Poronia punctata]
MPSRSVIAAALLASTTLAFPTQPGLKYKTVYTRDNPDGCDDVDDEGNPYIADLAFFSDQDCNDKTGYVCVYTYQSTIDSGSGAYSCNPGLLPGNTPFYAKVEDSPIDSMQLVFTHDQSCPPTGPGAVFATLIDNKSCVQFNEGGEGPGISIFPSGGSGLSLVEPKPPKNSKRDGPKCSGFTAESQSPTSSQSVQVSSIVDCTNGGAPGCSITVGEQHTESVSTSFSATAGGGIEGIFEVSATFGTEYTDSTTTSIQEGLSVQQGQKGYLAAYNAATLFKGKFTGCDSGDEEQEGTALVLKENGFTYSIVNTGI